MTVTTPPTIGVLMVCMGNICRSPTAEGVFRQLLRDAGLSARIEVDSAGTHAYHVGEPPDRRAQQAARSRGIDLSKQRARAAVVADFQRFDWIIAMDRANLENLQRLRPEGGRARLHELMEFAPQAVLSEVPDPYYGGSDGFEQVLDLVEEGSRGLLARIRAEHGL